MLCGKVCRPDLNIRQIRLVASVTAALGLRIAMKFQKTFIKQYGPRRNPKIGIVTQCPCI